jgi:putative SOS response-associated peptidase YedK
MCGRLSIAVSKKDLKEYLNDFYGIEVLPEEISLPKFNVAPGEDLISLVSDGEKFRVGLLKWGFVPEFKKKLNKPIINARSETVDKLYSFKKSFYERRCVILADGFFEWERSTGTKTPYRFVLKNKRIFAFAGLWTVSIDELNQKVYTTTIITTKANSLMKDIHDRMPVILNEDQVKIWLDPKLKDQEALKKILVPFDSVYMDFYEVSKVVNNASNKSEETIKPIKKSTD